MNSIKHTRGFDIARPIEQVFPLFSPEGEKLWAPGWNYENVMGDIELSENYVFLTRSHDHAAAKAIWLVKRYRPDEGFIEFYRVEPEEKIGLVTVHCSDTIKDKTHVKVSYEYIAISEKGREFIESFTLERYEHFIDEWKVLLDRYFDSAVTTCPRRTLGSSTAPMSKPGVQGKPII